MHSLGSAQRGLTADGERLVTQERLGRGLGGVPDELFGGGQCGPRAGEQRCDQGVDRPAQLAIGYDARDESDLPGLGGGERVVEQSQAQQRVQAEGVDEQAAAPSGLSPTFV